LRLAMPDVRRDLADQGLNLSLGAQMKVLSMRVAECERLLGLEISRRLLAEAARPNFSRNDEAVMERAQVPPQGEVTVAKGTPADMSGFLLPIVSGAPGIEELVSPRAKRSDAGAAFGFESALEESPSVPRTSEANLTSILSSPRAPKVDQLPEPARRSLQGKTDLLSSVSSVLVTGELVSPGSRTLDASTTCAAEIAWEESQSVNPSSRVPPPPSPKVFQLPEPTQGVLPSTTDMLPTPDALLSAGSLRDGGSFIVVDRLGNRFRLVSDSSSGQGTNPSQQQFYKHDRLSSAGGSSDGGSVVRSLSTESDSRRVQYVHDAERTVADGSKKNGVPLGVIGEDGLRANLAAPTPTTLELDRGVRYNSFGRQSVSPSSESGSLPRVASYDVRPLAHVHDREKSNDDSSKRSLMGRLRRLLTSAAFEAKHVTRMFEEANTIELKGSAWDMTLFMFYHPLGIWTNISVFACVAFNTSLQLAFTYIVNGFIAPSNDDLDELLVGFNQWRNNASQHVQELVCESSFALGSEYRQQETYFKFYDYTSDGELNSPGFILCCAVCAVWSLTVLKPVGELLDQMKATWHLCSSQCTIMEIAVVPGGFALERIPIARHIFFVLMGCIQLLIAVGLLIAGLRWLGSTNDIVELLLNGVALSYIMEIDELTYSVLVPTKVATLIQRLQPISVGWSMRLPVRTMLLAVPLMIMMAFVVFTLLIPHLGSVLAAQDALCP